MQRWLLLFGCLLLTLGAAPPGGAPVEIREWPVPWPDTRPRDPAVDAQGRVCSRYLRPPDRILVRPDLC